MRYGKKTYASLIAGVCVVLYLLYKYYELKTSFGSSVSGVIASTLAGQIIDTSLYLTLAGGVICILASYLGIPYISLLGILLGIISMLRIPGEAFSDAQLPYVISTGIMLAGFVVDILIDSNYPAQTRK